MRRLGAKAGNKYLRRRKIGLLGALFVISEMDEIKYSI